MPLLAKQSNKMRDFGALEKLVRKGVTEAQASKAFAKINFEAASDLFHSIVSETRAGSMKQVSQPDSAKITRLMYMFDLAKEAFGDENLATEFLTRKHPKLKVAPIDKLDTEWGGREVEQLLNSIVYGLPA